MKMQEEKRYTSYFKHSSFVKPEMIGRNTPGYLLPVT